MPAKMAAMLIIPMKWKFEDAFILNEDQIEAKRRLKGNIVHETPWMRDEAVEAAWR